MMKKKMFKKSIVGFIIALLTAGTVTSYGYVNKTNDVVVGSTNAIVKTSSTGGNSTLINNGDSIDYNGATYKIIQVDGGDLSGSRQSNVAVDIGYGDRVYWAFTNEYGQLVYVTADKITLQDGSIEPVNSNGRYYPDEAKVPGTEREDLDEGHTIAEAKAAGYSMPIYSDYWLYKYMDDRDHDGMVGE